MTLIQVLETFVITRIDVVDITTAAASVGGLVFILLELCELFVMTYMKKPSISNDTKRQLGMALAVAIPAVAYFGLVYSTDRPLAFEGVVLAAILGIAAAKGVHDLIGRHTGDAIYKAASIAQDKSMSQIKAEAVISSAK